MQQIQKYDCTAQTLGRSKCWVIIWSIHSLPTACSFHSMQCLPSFLPVTCRHVHCAGAPEVACSDCSRSFPSAASACGRMHVAHALTCRHFCICKFFSVCSGGALALASCFFSSAANTRVCTDVATPACVCSAQCSGGVLALASCSSHITFPMFHSICNAAVQRARRTATVISVRGQPADHPYPAPCTELRYLKFIAHVLD